MSVEIHNHSRSWLPKIWTLFFLEDQEASSVLTIIQLVALFLRLEAA